MLRSETDFLKVNKFAQSKFADCKLCAETCVKNDIKCETRKNFIKL